MQKIAAVIGTTGVGKSQLGVELCKVLRGQVINADSMQVYKGLDIITNKMNLAERQDIPHHLMDFLEPEEEYKVTQFTQDANAHIEDILAKGELPVVVGGTNYYIQSLLWNNTLIDEGVSPQAAAGPFDDRLDELQTSELYEKLQQVDEIMAKKWHPSNRRKILRSLRIYYNTGKPQSEIIKQQRDNSQEQTRSKFKALVFWLYADPVGLNPRLDERVEKMIEIGLFDEIRSLRKRVLEGTVKQPGQGLEQYQRGLWQAIGYKEFDPYFTSVEDKKTDDKELERIRVECTERMKSATRRYAKRQVQWIRNKFLPGAWQTPDDVAVYLLDATDLDAWDTNVRQRAIEIAQAFWSNLPMVDPLSLSNAASSMLQKPDQVMDMHTRVLSWTKHTCPVCKTEAGDPLTLNGDLEWQQHQRSRYHRKTLKQLRSPPVNRPKPNSSSDDTTFDTKTTS